MLKVAKNIKSLCLRSPTEAGKIVRLGNSNLGEGRYEMHEIRKPLDRF